MVVPFPTKAEEVQWKFSNMDKLLIPLPCQEYLATSIRGPQTVEQLIKATELGKAAIAPPKATQEREFCQHPGELHKTDRNLWAHTPM